MYILVVHGKEVKSGDGTPLAKEDEEFLVTEEADGWVEATSTSFRWALQVCGGIPGGVKVFDTKEDAEKFAAKWKGHPWWCKPNGKFEVIEVKPKYNQILVGYERAD